MTKTNNKRNETATATTTATTTAKNNISFESLSKETQMEIIKKLGACPALNDEQIELLKKLETDVEIGEQNGVLFSQHSDFDNEDLKIFSDNLTEEQIELIESTKRHYQKVTETTLRKEAYMRAAQNLLNEKARKSFNEACNVAGIISPEKERKNKLRNEIVKNAADYIAIAAVFFAGVLSAKKYFNKK